MLRYHAAIRMAPRLDACSTHCGTCLYSGVTARLCSGGYNNGHSIYNYVSYIYYIWCASGTSSVELELVVQRHPVGALAEALSMRRHVRTVRPAAATAAHLVLHRSHGGRGEHGQSDGVGATDEYVCTDLGRGDRLVGLLGGLTAAPGSFCCLLCVGTSTSGCASSREPASVCGRGLFSRRLPRS